MRRLGIVAVAVLLVAGCSHADKPITDPISAFTTPPPLSPSASPSPSPSASSTPATTPAASSGVLPVGKLDLVLAPGTWRSPVGFAPPLRFTVPAGWNSVHRGTDGFDIGQPDPAKDAPLVAVVFLTPRQSTAAAALTAVTTAANGDVEPITGSVGGVRADAVDITGGSGQLIAGRSNGIALDAADGQRARLFALTAAGAPLIVVVLVPDQSKWDSVWPGVAKILASVKFG